MVVVCPERLVLREETARRENQDCQDSTELQVKMGPQEDLVPLDLKENQGSQVCPAEACLVPREEMVHQVSA